VMTWLAWDLTAGEAEPESTEDLSVWRLPFEELVELVLDGTVFDSMTVAAVTLVETRRHRGLASGLPDAVLSALRG
jgi:hypothetical protein